jgi:hypothetical protein
MTQPTAFDLPPQAVDLAARGTNRYFFVPVRPPGHHAGPKGAVPAGSFWKAPGMCSNGRWGARVSSDGSVVLTKEVHAWVCQGSAC